MTFEAQGLPTVCVISDAFEGLGLATRSGMLAVTPGAESPPFTIIPYPVSGLERDAVEAKARRAVPEIVHHLLGRLGGAA